LSGPSACANPNSNNLAADAGCDAPPTPNSRARTTGGTQFRLRQCTPTRSPRLLDAFGPSDVAQIGEPQSAQNACWRRLPLSSVFTQILGSSVFNRKSPSEHGAMTRKAAPDSCWQSVQWHMRTFSGPIIASKVMTPQWHESVDKHLSLRLAHRHFGRRSQRSGPTNNQSGCRAQWFPGDNAAVIWRRIHLICGAGGFENPRASNLRPMLAYRTVLTGAPKTAS